MLLYFEQNDWKALSCYYGSFIGTILLHLRIRPFYRFNRNVLVSVYNISLRKWMNNARCVSFVVDILSYAYALFVLWTKWLESAFQELWHFIFEVLLHSRIRPFYLFNRNVLVSIYSISWRKWMNNARCTTFSSQGYNDFEHIAGKDKTILSRKTWKTIFLLDLFHFLKILSRVMINRIQGTWTVLIRWNVLWFYYIYRNWPVLWYFVWFSSVLIVYWV